MNNCVEVNRSNSSGGENRHSRTNSGAEQDSFEDHEDDDVAVSLGMCTAMYPFEGQLPHRNFILTFKRFL